jgi:hypothetical protein
MFQIGASARSCIWKGGARQVQKQGRDGGQVSTRFRVTSYVRQRHSVIIDLFLEGNLFIVCRAAAGARASALVQAAVQAAVRLGSGVARRCCRFENHNVWFSSKEIGQPHEQQISPDACKRQWHKCPALNTVEDLHLHLAGP